MLFLLKAVLKQAQAVSGGIPQQEKKSYNREEFILTCPFYLNAGIAGENVRIH